MLLRVVCVVAVLAAASEAVSTTSRVDLPINTSTTAHVQYHHRRGAIELHLCGKEHCSLLLLAGVRSDETMRYAAFTHCNLWARECRDKYKINNGGHAKFPSGVVELEVHRRPGFVDVWTNDREDRKVSVPVEKDYKTLIVRPSSLSNPVKFTVSCSCRNSKHPPCQASKYSPEHGACAEIQPGSINVVKEAQRISEKLRCHNESKGCQLQRGTSKRFGREWGIAQTSEKSTTQSSSHKIGVSIEADISWFSPSTSYSYEFGTALTRALSQTKSHGWSSETSESTTYTCLIDNGHTGWVEARPEYIGKTAIIYNKNGTRTEIGLLFPKTGADGSIAGKRRCVVEKNSGSWRRKRDVYQRVPKDAQ